jgi:hypothetical protein
MNAFELFFYCSMICFFLLFAIPFFNCKPQGGVHSDSLDRLAHSMFYIGIVFFSLAGCFK